MKNLSNFAKLFIGLIVAFVVCLGATCASASYHRSGFAVFFGILTFILFFVNIIIATEHDWSRR